MLTAAYIFSFTGMILFPILSWMYFTRRFSLSWKLVLAGGLTFIASQVLHIPLVIGMGSLMQSLPLVVNAILLGLLAGIFEETARYVLFKLILKNTRSWNEGILVGLGHGGTEALLTGISVAATFVFMLGYRSIDLSTVPSIPPEQLELAKQQVAAYWSTPWYMPFVGLIERVFAMCLHVSLSVMVLYAVAYRKPIWFWLALLWHAFVDAAAVYAGQQVGTLAAEGIVAVCAIISVWIVLRMRAMFSEPEAIPVSANVQA